MTAQLIASGIENMQVQYGVSTEAGMRFYDASTVPASLWTSVVAVRLWLLARSTTPEPGIHQHRVVRDGRPDGHRERRLPAPGFPAGRADTQVNPEDRATDESAHETLRDRAGNAAHRRCS